MVEIYYEKHEYIAALIGGLLIGISSTLNLLFYGKITGLSGIFSGLLYPEKGGDVAWRYNFLVGLITIPQIMHLVYGRVIHFSDFNLILFDNDDQVAENESILGFIIAGLLVGFGTKLGNGCTSGHGVCGLPRFSVRSIVAVLVFMAFGFATASLRYQFKLLQSGDFWGGQWSSCSVYVWILLLLVVLISWIKERGNTKLLVVQFFLGCLFGKGLVVSGMCRQSKILGFLTIRDGWDPSLIFVMLSAVSLNALTFNYIINVKKVPIYVETFAFPKKTELELPMILGNALFGIGWGLSGFCPGPAFAIMLNTSVILAFIIFMIIGSYLAIMLQKQIDLNNKEKIERNSNSDNVELTKNYR